MDRTEKIKLLAQMTAQIYAAELQASGGEIENVGELISECVIDAVDILEKVSEIAEKN